MALTCSPQQITQKCVVLYNFIAAFTHPIAVLLWKNWVHLQACVSSSTLDSSQQPHTSPIVQHPSCKRPIAAFIIGNIVILTIDVTFGRINSSSPGYNHDISGLLCSPTHFLAMSRSTLTIVQLHSFATTWVNTSKYSFIGQDLSHGVSALLSSSVSRHHHIAHQKFWCNEIYSNVDEFPLHSRVVINPVLPSVEANL
jgi:hypothetical protein